MATMLALIMPPTFWLLFLRCVPVTADWQSSRMEHLCELDVLGGRRVVGRRADLTNGVQRRLLVEAVYSLHNNAAWPVSMLSCTANEKFSANTALTGLSHG